MDGFNRHEVQFVAAGRHANPLRGGSVLELSSTLRDSRWDSFPRFLPPPLRSAIEATCVNTSAAGRVQLAFAVPWVAGLPTCSDEAAIAIIWRAIAAVSQRPSEHEGSTPVAGGRRGSRGSKWVRWYRSFTARSVVNSAIRDAVRQVAFRGGDPALRTLLSAIIDDIRAEASLPPIHIEVPPPGERATLRLPVKSRLLFMGGDETRLEAVAILDEWPDWLRRSWQFALSEM